MMAPTHLVISDQHAHPAHNNDRADWLGKLIMDLKPDVVINIGDAADLPSLNSFDKGKAAFNGKSYEADIEAHLDFQERLWAPIKRAKRKMPYRIFLEGNHEHRIKKAINMDPHLEGSRFGISFRELDLDRHYNEVVEYSGQTPGLYSIHGVTYGHYMISGVMGRPIGGEHHAHSLIAKNLSSCTVGHSHTVDWAVRTVVGGRKVMGCVAGVYQDYDSDWAGNVNHLWWQGLVVKRGVEDGVYSPEFVSINKMKEEYTL